MKVYIVTFAVYGKRYETINEWPEMGGVYSEESDAKAKERELEEAGCLTWIYATHVNANLHPKVTP